MIALKADPPVRLDGKCAVCRVERVVTKQARRYAGVQIDQDPFCSSPCARRFHGCELPLVGTEAQAASRAEMGVQRSEQSKAERGWDDEADIDAVYAELSS